MSLLLESSIRWSIMLLVVWAFAAAWRGSAGWRHLAWCIGAAGGLLFIGLHALGPTLTVAVPWLHSPAIAAGAGASLASADAAPDVVESGGAATWLVGAWSIGALLLICWTALGLFLSFRITKDADVVERSRPPVSEPYPVLSSRRVATPITTGLFKPVILLPAQALHWSDDRWNAALAHEAAHARRRDVLLRCLGALACAFHWPNPLAWLMLSRIRCEAELAADEAVLAEGVEAAEYAELLLHCARRSSRRPLVSVSMSRGNLSRRISSMLGERHRRRPPAGGHVLLGFMLAVTLVAPAAIVRLVPPPPKVEEAASLTIEVGEHANVPMEGLRRLTIDSPHVLDVRPDAPSGLTLEGLAPGAATVLVWTGAEEPRELRVVVGDPETSALPAEDVDRSHDKSGEQATVHRDGAFATESIRLGVGDTHRLPVPGLSRAAMSNPSILDVSVTDNQELVVDAKAPGRSTVITWHGDEEPTDRFLFIVE